MKNRVHSSNKISNLTLPPIIYALFHNEIFIQASTSKGVLKAHINDIIMDLMYKYSGVRRISFWHNAETCAIERYTVTSTPVNTLLATERTDCLLTLCTYRAVTEKEESEEEEEELVEEEEEEEEEELVEESEDDEESEEDEMKDVEEEELEKDKEEEELVEELEKDEMKDVEEEELEKDEMKDNVAGNSEPISVETISSL